MPARDQPGVDSDASVRVRTIETDAVTWHVQEAGAGQTLLLLHGTGSSGHSWRGLLPQLAARYHVVAPDLPGHGASKLHDEHALSLDGMSRATAGLLDTLALSPELIVGHSAGAALAARALLDGRMRCDSLISINGAFVPFGGAVGQLFSPLAKAFAASGWLAHFIARHARSPQSVERLLASTGSVIDEQYLDDYRRLFASPDHVAATLGMMANWDLWTLQRDMPALPARLFLLVGTADRTVPPAQAYEVAGAVPGAQVVRLEQLGHLAHEENPDAVAQALFRRVDARATHSR